MSKSFQSLYINNEKRRVVPTVLYILIAFMGTAGTVFSFVSCFGFEVKLSLYLIWIGIMLPLCLLYLNEWFRDKLLLLFLLGSVFYVIFCFDTVLSSVVEMCNIVIKDINDSYSMGIRMIILPEQFAKDGGVETALMLLTVIITFLTSYFVLGRSSVIGCFVVSMPLSIFGIFFDIFPRLEFLMLSVTFWIVAVILHASGKRGKRVADGAVYNGLFAVVSIWILFIISQAVLPESRYERGGFLESAKIYIERNVSMLTEYGGTNRAGIGNGTFGDAEEVYFTGETVLEVKFPYMEQNIYLRTREYNEYTGNAWENNDTYFRNYFNDGIESLQIQNITAFILKNLKDELDFYDADEALYREMVGRYLIQVRNFTYSDVPFAPYGAEFETGTMKTDVMPETNRASVSKYTVYTAYDLQRFCDVFPAERFLSQWNMISAQIPSMQDAAYYQMLSAEEAYASFVRKAYTQVPGELKDVLSPYVSETVEYNCASEMAFAKKIRDYFAMNYEYTLMPGRVPQGRDGVEYFLNENRKGYCVYFASAATLIFRQAGIPARYVEGFIISTDMMQNADSDNSGNVTVAVADNKAHAWPEIYIAGYGWVPVEVTPGFYTENAGVKLPESTTDWDGPIDDDEEEEEDDADTQTDANSKNEESKDEKGILGGVKAALWFAIIVMLMGGACLTCVLVGKRNSKKVFALLDGTEKSDNKEQVLLLWRYIERLLLFKKVKIPDNLTVAELKQFLKEHFVCFSNADWDDKIDCIMEVYFGKKIPSDKETDDISEIARCFRQETESGLNRMEKFRFHMIHGL